MVRPSCLLFGRLGPKKKTLTECHAPNNLSLIWFVGTKLVKDRVFSRTMPNRSISKVGAECSTRVKLSVAWNRKKKKHNPISQAAGPLRKAVRIWMITLRKKNHHQTSFMRRSHSFQLFFRGNSFMQKFVQLKFQNRALLIKPQGLLALPYNPPGIT